jgi:general stress protein 26
MFASIVPNARHAQHTHERHVGGHAARGLLPIAPNRPESAMAKEEQTRKSEAELAERAWHVVSAAHTATLITVDNGTPIARPMSPKADAEAGVVFFLTQADSPKRQRDGDVATVFFIDGNTYVSMTGAVALTNDRAKIKQLWTPFAKAWWDSPDDPDIRVLEIRVREGEIWDGPNKLFAGALMLTAAVTGAKPKIGDHAKVAL